MLDEDISVSNITNEAAKFGVQGKDVVSSYLLLAATAIEFERQCWQRLEQQLVSASQQGGLEFCYIDCASYDSADFFMKTLQTMTEKVYRCEPDAIVPLGADDAATDTIEFVEEVE
eukprot:6064205-Heterocapsa_arctica.AAC.1